MACEALGEIHNTCSLQFYIKDSMVLLLTKRVPHDIILSLYMDYFLLQIHTLGRLSRIQDLNTGRRHQESSIQILYTTA